MDKRDSVDDRHTHPCGHDCKCRWGDGQLCDRCELADVVIRRHQLGAMSRGEALARLYLALAVTAGEGMVRLDSVVVEDMIELERGLADWSR